MLAEIQIKIIQEMHHRSSVANKCERERSFSAQKKHKNMAIQR